MSSRGSGWPEGIVEAAWLAALAIVPLLFNVLSSSTFELDKVTMLRSLAIAVALAWALSSVERWRCRRRPVPDMADSPGGISRGLRSWLWLVLAFAAVFAVATVGSIAPRVSLWGSASRVQGLYTTAGFVVLHLSLIAVIRRRDQIDRLVLAAVLTSLPVALYGIIQHAGGDPIPWVNTFSQRVASTLGNPTFLAGWIVFVIPLTLYHQIVAIADAGRGEDNRLGMALASGSLLNTIVLVAAWWLGPLAGSVSAAMTLAMWAGEGVVLGTPLRHAIRIGAYTVVLSAQIACLLFTQSRGPLLGVAASLVVFGLAWALTRGRWITPRGVGTVALGALVAVSAATLSTRGLDTAGEGRYLGRFSNLFESTGRVRLLIWDATTRVMVSEPLRGVLGYGPETLRLIIAPHVSPALGHVEQRGGLPDRAHNEVLDAWVTTGLPGVLIGLTLFGVLFRRGLETAGIVQSPRDRRALRVWLLTAAALGAGGALAIGESRGLAGPGLALGMFAGLCGFLMLRGTAGAQPEAHADSVDADTALLAIAMLSALAGHFVEIQLGIPVTATRVYFWSIAALLVVLPHCRAQAPTESAATGAGQVNWWSWRDVLGPSLTVVLLLTTIMFTFSSRSGPESVPVTIVWLLLFTWLVSGVIIVAQVRTPVIESASSGWALRVVALYVLATLVPTAAFAASDVIWNSVLRTPGDEPRLLYVWVLLLMVFAAPLLGTGGLHGPSARWVWPVRLVALALLVAAVNATATAVRADIAHKDAVVGSIRGDDSELALERIRRAIALEPANPAHHATHAEILLERALGSADLRHAEVLFDQANDAILSARRLGPRDPDFPAQHARVHLRWGAHVTDGTQKDRRLLRAIQLYDEALAVSPANVLLWNELGVAYLLKGDLDLALDTFRQSIGLDARFAETHLHVANTYRRKGDLDGATHAFATARALLPPERRGAMEALAQGLLRPDRLGSAGAERAASPTVQWNAPRLTPPGPGGKVP